MGEIQDGCTMMKVYCTLFDKQNYQVYIPAHFLAGTGHLYETQYIKGRQILRCDPFLIQNR